MLVFSSICPHPPLLIPSIGNQYLDKVKSTTEAMKKLGKDFENSKAETVVIISPHGQVRFNVMSITLTKNLKGDFTQFGDDTYMEFENDIDLTYSIEKFSKSKKIPIEILHNDVDLDHGAMVPLYFLSKNSQKVKIAPIAFSYLDYKTHFDFGKAIYKAIENSSKKIALVASGDLSHCLTGDAPAGYCEQGKKFDKTLINLLEKNEVDKILNIDQELIQEAKECGLRSIIILLGAMSLLEYKFEKLSYEGPFGVGYLVGKFRF